MTRFSAEELLRLSRSELEAFKGKKVDINTKLSLVRGTISGLIIDNMNLEEAKIMGFLLGCNTTIRFNEIVSLDVIIE